MSDTITFETPQRIAILYETFEDEEGDPIEAGQWVQERETVNATHIHYRDLVVAFENRETEDCLVIGAEKFISAWTEGIND